MLTLVGIVGTAVAAFVFGLDIGVVAMTAAVLLSLVSGDASKAAVGQIAWPTVLLITGIVTYVGLMQSIGTIDWLGNRVADIGVPLLAALVICFIGAAVSAFASTTGILAALIPLAVPFLLSGQVGAVGMIIALALSSSVVDSSPVLDVGCAVRGELAGGPEGLRLPSPAPVGHVDDHLRADHDVVDLRRSRMAVGPPDASTAAPPGPRRQDVRVLAGGDRSILTRSGWASRADPKSTLRRLSTGTDEGFDRSGAMDRLDVARVDCRIAVMTGQRSRPLAVSV